MPKLTKRPNCIVRTDGLTPIIENFVFNDIIKLLSDIKSLETSSNQCFTLTEFLYKLKSMNSLSYC